MSINTQKKRNHKNVNKIFAKKEYKKGQLHTFTYICLHLNIKGVNCYIPLKTHMCVSMIIKDRNALGVYSNSHKIIRKFLYFSL